MVPTIREYHRGTMKLARGVCGVSDWTLRLKPGEHRARRGSPWIYRGEFYATEAPAGALVSVVAENGRFLGYGLYNPRSVIAVRVVSWKVQETVTAALFQERVRRAARLREEVAAGRDAFRVIHSESDGLPGVVVDKYGPALVVEVTSLGMVPYMPAIIETLTELYQPIGIYERGDLAVRDREGLPREDRLWYGDVPTEVVIHEHDVRMTIDLAHGQKTGHFLDQYENRGVVAKMAAGREVFDAFCHTGGFALATARHGARRVVGVDIDARVISEAERNAHDNELGDVAHFVTANAFDWLRKESDKGPSYDLGILDPPAFTKSKETVPQALKGYKEINLRGMKLIRPGGFLVTSSCSYHLSEPDFIRVIQDAAFDAKRIVRIVGIRGQGPDHPVLPALPESRYLKCLVLAVD